MDRRWSDASGDDSVNVEQEWRERYGEELTERPDFILEGLLLEVTERIWQVMQEQDVSRSELADRLGVSRQYISNFLNTPSNTTLKTIVEMAQALDLEVEVTLKPKKHDEPGAEETGEVPEAAAHE